MTDSDLDDMKRRDFLKLTGAACLASLFGPGPAWAENSPRPNILFITADDMNWDSVGAFGCGIPDITPNLDKLASQGMRFSRAHVPIALCQPCRAAMLTGRYPHNNGATGFGPIRPEVGTLGEALDAAGYWNGVIGKGRHYQPTEKFHWHFFIEATELGNGRDPDRYYQHARQFIASAKEKDKPFFLHANAHDPHRPFDLEDGVSGRPFTRLFKPEDIVVPGFLPDIPPVRKEVASYFNGVHRADETVGMVLQALAESGLDRSTIVLFLSDGGMSFPFAKGNCYLNSTKTPLIIRWPDRIKPGGVNQDLVSCVDLAPTLLAAVGAPPLAGIDGQSLLPALFEQSYPARRRIYTQFYETAMEREYAMRAVITDDFVYIFNAWSAGATRFLNQSQKGLSMAAMLAAAETDKDIAARVRLFLYRVPEELYDVRNDPNALRNLAGDPQYKDPLAEARNALAEEMTRYRDPLLNLYRQRILNG